jgi:hypothetical protein
MLALQPDRSWKAERDQPFPVRRSPPDSAVYAKPVNSIFSRQHDLWPYAKSTETTPKTHCTAKSDSGDFRREFRIAGLSKPDDFDGTLINALTARVCVKL